MMRHWAVWKNLSWRQKKKEIYSCLAWLYEYVSWFSRNLYRWVSHKFCVTRLTLCSPDIISGTQAAHATAVQLFDFPPIGWIKSHNVFGHMYVVSYFSVVYFYGVNLKILCVDWLLLHIFCVVWFLVLSLRQCNCKSNLTAMRCVSLDCCLSRMCCVSLDFPTNGAVCCVSGVPPTVNSTGSSDDQRLLSHSVLYSTLLSHFMLYSTLLSQPIHYFSSLCSML